MNSTIFMLMAIYGGSALLATIFLYLKQPVVLAYIFAGMILGPAGFSIIENSEEIKEYSHFGIILLMFLIGLNLKPNDLLQLFKKTAFLTFVSSTIFSSIVAIVLLLLGYSLIESIIAGVALIFSSTVVGLKLIPTTDLHNKRIGELMISILLLQDIIAIVAILVLSIDNQKQTILTIALFLILKLTSLLLISFIGVKHVVSRLFAKYDIIQEYIFVLAIGWALVLAELAYFLGLSHEIGAFIAGVALATSPISLIIAEKLKPIREFFLILFFFAIGAQFDILLTQHIWVAGVLITAIIVVMKPLVYKSLFSYLGEKKETSKELGLRLGQSSEFALLLAATASTAGAISNKMESLISFIVIASFVVSTYFVMANYSTPISVDAKNRRD
jgi:Kef-type K+ transport system membrane component KefB